MRKYHTTIYLTLALACLAGTALADVSDETDAQLRAGLEAMNKYDFKSARTHLEKYKTLAKKEGAEPDWRADEALGAIPLAEDMLAGRVEKIVIVDSLSVPKRDFFKAYRLSLPSGTLVADPDMKRMGAEWADMEPVSPAYESEGGAVRYVAVESETVDEEDGSVEEITRLYEGFRLGDGSWSEPTPLFDEDVDAAFPFMLSDGCTFYFASRSEQGLGGYDIFRSYRDSDTGEFQNPVNMGLPYNSPSDDYMLAIDEYTGAGWWATDRNGAVDGNGDELVTIYVFVPSEMRENYDADTPGIKSLAALWTLHFPQETHLDGEDDETDMSRHTQAVPGWKMTWPDGADYSELMGDIHNAGAEGRAEPDEFRFTGDKGKVYTRYGQLPPMAIAPMQRYQERRELLDRAETNLRSMRREYRATPSDAMRSEIYAAQTHVDKLRRETRKARNEVFQALRAE